MGLITAGCAVWALGMNALLVPNRILSGGMVGLAMIVHDRAPWMNLAFANLLLNIPLLVMSWFWVGRQFFWYSLFGIFVFSLLAWLLPVPALVLPHPLLAALVAGPICGVGGWLILRSGGSAGGFDILAIWASRRWGLKVGTLICSINGVILGLGAWRVGPKSALYAVAFVFVCGKVIDLAYDWDSRRSPNTFTVAAEKGEPDQEDMSDLPDLSDPGDLSADAGLAPGDVVC